MENKVTGRPFVQGLVLISALLMLLVACPRNAAAQGKLKRLVFEDCQKAGKDFAALSVEDRTEFLSYLARVLKMQSGVSGELFAEGVPPISPQTGRDALPGGNLWRIFDPSREAEAKHCALKLIGARAEEAFFLLPDLVQVYQDASTAPDIRDGIEYVVWSITNAVKQSTAGNPDPKIYSALISQLSFDRAGFLAANVLIELHSTTLPYLLSALASPDMRRRASVQNVLFRLDGTGEIIGPSIVPLLDSGDEDLRVKGIELLAQLEAFYPRAIPVLISRLSDPAPVVEEAVFQAFRRIFADEPIAEPIPLEPSHVTTLFGVLARSSFERRSVLEPLIRSVLMQRPELAAELTALVKSPDADLRERAVRLLAESNLPSPVSFPLLSEALYDKAHPVRVAAVRGLGGLPDRSSDSASAFVRVMKSAGSERDLLQREQLVLAVAEAASRLPVNSALERLTPYLVDGLSMRNGNTGSSATPVVENDAVRALIHLGSDASAPVTKALKSDDALVRQRAIYILSHIEPHDRQAAKALVFMLRDADAAVCAAAVEAVVRLGPEFVSEVEKGLSWKEPDDRLAAARVLNAFGRGDAEVAAAFRDSFSRANCEEKSSLVGTLVKLDPEFREKVQPFLFDCMPESPLVYADQLTMLLPLQPELVTRFGDTVQNAVYPMNIRLQLLRRAPKLGVPISDVSRALLSMLRQADNSLKNQIVGYLAELGNAAANAVEPLKELIEDEKTDGALKNQSAFALSQLSPDSFPWEQFFIKELASDHAQWALKTIPMMNPVQAVPFLEKALKELTPEKRGAVLSLVGTFGSGAAPLKQTLIQHSKDADPFIRHQAVLALAQVDANEPELIPALRRELIGPFAVEMQRENLPVSVLPILEQILAQPKSFVEQRMASAVIAELRSR